MSLPDAAAEFARQLVTALAGDAGRLDSTEAELDELRDYVKAGEEKQQLLIVERDRLRGAVQEVLRQEGDLLTAARAQLLRDALGEARQANVTSKTVARLECVTRQRDELLAAVKWVLHARTTAGGQHADAALRDSLARIEREVREEG